MKIFLVDLESIPTRYTCEWKTHIPKLLRDNGFNVQVIEGEQNIPESTTPGAFLNFGGTNMYKAKQVYHLSYMFTKGHIKAGDHIIFTDAWHPGIINVKYMSELLNIPVVTHGLWHAGSYDPNDFLGRLVGDKPWIRHAEQAFIGAYDHNWIASVAHYNLIKRTYDLSTDRSWDRTGWPMEYTIDTIKSVPFSEKENIIVFPHRLAPEKRLDLFHELAARPELAHYQFCVAMEMDLTKPEYHKLLQRAKFSISFAEQETLGISMYESACAGAFPIVPDDLSYIEMYINTFRYDKGTDLECIDSVVNLILKQENKDMSDDISKLVNKLHKNYFSANQLIDILKNYDDTSK
jgi:glycosyltransferase involved in cell wall biosynthesis